MLRPFRRNAAKKLQLHKSEALKSRLAGIKDQISVDVNYWNVMYQPIFDKLQKTGQLFKGKEDNLYLLACRDLPRLIRHSKRSVSKDISEQPLKIYVTTVCYVALLITSAFRRYEIFTKNSEEERFALYPWHSEQSCSDEVLIKARATVTSSAPFVCEVVHWLVDNPSIWRWLYKEPSWVEKLYRECLSGGDSGLILGSGVVFFDNPFSGFVLADEEPGKDDTPPEQGTVQAKDEPSNEKMDSLEKKEVEGESDLLLDTSSDDDVDLDAIIAEEARKAETSSGKEAPDTQEENVGSLDIAREYTKFISDNGKS